jgi:hypothetical protein
MKFTEFLLIESDKGMLQALADDIIDQFAEEGRWNHDDMMRVAQQRLEQSPEFKNQPRKLESALAAISYYLTR